MSLSSPCSVVTEKRWTISMRSTRNPNVQNCEHVGMVIALWALRWLIIWNEASRFIFLKTFVEHLLLLGVLTVLYLWNFHKLRGILMICIKIICAQWVEETCSWLHCSSELGLTLGPARGNKRAWQVACLRKGLSLQLSWKGMCLRCQLLQNSPVTLWGAHEFWVGCWHQKRISSRLHTDATTEGSLVRFVFLAKQGAGNKVENDFHRECL